MFQTMTFNFLALLCASTSIASPDGGEEEEEEAAAAARELAPRGYYGGFGYPYLPFLEPLTILAVLGFLAFLIQTFHAMYHNHNAGLVGGLLNNVLPGTHKGLATEAARAGDGALKAIELYEALDRSERKRRKHRSDVTRTDKP